MKSDALPSDTDAEHRDAEHDTDAEHRDAEHDTDEYILGTEAAELERLRFQHHVWTQAAHELFERASLRAGEAVLDLGCGPGFTTFELAERVGPTGHVLARDQSARFLAFLGREASRLRFGQIETSLGPVEDLDLPARSLDAAYSRWLFCWLSQPDAVLERVTRALRPGGRILLQEYLDWGALRLLPHGPAFARAVEACLLSWKAGGATIDFAAHAPELAARHRLALEHFRPRARLGRVGSPEWRWLEQFFSIYLPKVAERGLLTSAEVAAWRVEWDERAAEDASFLMTPTMADVILVKR